MRREAIRHRIAWVRKAEGAFRRSYGHGPVFLVTYDANRVSRNRAADVSHFIFGRVVKRASRAATVEYAYRGFVVRPGVLWVGQSVLLMTDERRAELERYLSDQGVAHYSFVISIP